MAVVKLHPPPGTTPTRETASNPHPPDTPAVLIDALAVRTEVFIEEQGCSAENEVDEDDARSWHWVMYAGGSEADRAIGTIRLVPPHPRPGVHPAGDANANANGDDDDDGDDQEPYIKLTRVAVVRPLRGHGIGRHLVETAVEWARAHPDEINGAFQGCPSQSPSTTPTPTRSPSPAHGVVSVPGTAGLWTGLVLVHAQVDVEGMYGRLGFERDDAMGRWLEEGIEHVGMWNHVHTE